MFDCIKKRDGRIIEFKSSKITSAIARAGKATGEFGKGKQNLRRDRPKAEPPGRDNKLYILSVL